MTDPFGGSLFIIGRLTRIDEVVERRQDDVGQVRRRFTWTEDLARIGYFPRKVLELFVCHQDVSRLSVLRDGHRLAISRHRHRLYIPQQLDCGKLAQDQSLQRN
jgi:hypothetical protein